MSTPNSDLQGFAFYGDSATTAKATVKVIQTGLVIGAVLSALVGIIVLSWPMATLVVVAVLFGLYFLVRGIVRVAVGIFAPGLTGGGRTLSIILGVLLVAVGIFALKNPGDSLALLGILIGISWVIDGIATLVESSNKASRGFAIAAGIISIVAGVVVLFVPIDGVATLTIIAGIFLIVLAVAQALGAIVLASAAKKASVA
ncbi:MAG: DUF308 domain-containing protein [Actinomycetales bacterium]|nr:DUF308 domain-containing protein [Actinomycetales bacterium]